MLSNFHTKNDNRNADHFHSKLTHTLTHNSHLLEERYSIFVVSANLESITNVY